MSRSFIGWNGDFDGVSETATDGVEENHHARAVRSDCRLLGCRVSHIPELIGKLHAVKRNGEQSDDPNKNCESFTHEIEGLFEKIVVAPID